MNRKNEVQDLDIPEDDIECWERYPKHHWVYDLSRLLDAQGIKWSPFEIDSLPDKELTINLETSKTLIRQPGYVYMKRSDGRHLLTEVYIVKGEIKLMRHIDPSTNTPLESIVGEIELKLNAFITLHFHKFTGVITTETLGNEIFRIRLSPHIELNNETNQEAIKLLKRIYKKTDNSVSGPTDRILQETLAS